MSLLVPDAGEVRLLNDLLAGGALEDWTLKLFKTNVTPAETDVPGSYTEADFTNYVAKTLTRAVGAGNWSAPSTTGGVTSSQYAQQSWTCGATGNTVYGYVIVGATSGVLLIAEAFASPRVLVNASVLNLTPRLELA